MGMSNYEKTLQSDRDATFVITGKYKGAIDLEMFSRCLKLTEAMNDFREFLHLPESSSRLKAWVEAGLAVLTLLQPEVFLVRFLGEEEQAVQSALEAKTTTGKLLRVAEKSREVAEKGKGGMEKYDQHQEKKEKRSQAPEATGKMAQLDSSKAPVEQMLDSYGKALEILDKANEALHKEYDKRLRAQSGRYNESLTDMAKRLLRIPQPFTAGQLAQLKTLYLWQLCSQWARNSEDVAIVGGGNILKGVNDTQEDTLLNWFGMYAPRGTLFNQGAFTAHDILEKLGARPYRDNAVRAVRIWRESHWQ